MTKIKTIRNFFIESLGCAKNSVDSRSMAELLTRAGYCEVSEAKEADLILVNTCGFIQPAREESIQMLKSFSDHKRKDQYLIAAGCLSQRDQGRLASLIPSLDALIGTRRWADILQVIERLQNNLGQQVQYFPETPRILESEYPFPRAARQGASAYLKIADGCDRRCAFCAIPLIKGPMVSRPLEVVIKDARMLAEQGVQEIILIAQDTTAYGRDLGYQDGLFSLLRELVKITPSIPWIRIMYTFPGSISEDLIHIMSEEPRILQYLDIPLQHAHPAVLRRMARPADMDEVRRTIERMRQSMPAMALRTTFITGFPGETEAEFNTLIDFIEEMQFDRVGIFTYYHEEGTGSFQMADSVPDDVKQGRVQALAAIQQDISLGKNQKMIGKEIEILLEGQGDGISVGRSYRDAPEIDGLVILNEVLEPGQIIPVRVTGALPYDLLAKRI